MLPRHIHNPLLFLQQLAAQMALLAQMTVAQQTIYVALGKEIVTDAGCQGDLICGSNNCDTSLGFPNDISTGSSWDCCYDPIADLWDAN